MHTISKAFLLVLTFFASAASMSAENILFKPFSDPDQERIQEIKERLLEPGAKEDLKDILSSAAILAKEYLERAIEEEESAKMRRIYSRMSEKFLSTTFEVQHSGRGYCSFGLGHWRSNTYVCQRRTIWLAK